MVLVIWKPFLSYMVDQTNHGAHKSGNTCPHLHKLSTIITPSVHTLWAMEIKLPYYVEKK